MSENKEIIRDQSGRFNVQCWNCGEWFMYQPYPGWKKDYESIQDLRENHYIECGECS